MTQAKNEDGEALRWGTTLRRADLALLRAKTTALKPTGLTLAQFVALVELEAQPGITGAALARACLVTPQAMTMVLVALQDGGLVERRPHHRHSNVLEVHLTKDGRSALDAGRNAVAPVEQLLAEAVPAGDGARLVRFLERVITALDEAT